LQCGGFPHPSAGTPHSDKTACKPGSPRSVDGQWSLAQKAGQFDGKSETTGWWTTILTGAACVSEVLAPFLSLLGRLSHGAELALLATCCHRCAPSKRRLTSSSVIKCFSCMPLG
jgi:hypothetical protein